MTRVLAAIFLLAPCSGRSQDEAPRQQKARAQWEALAPARKEELLRARKAYSAMPPEMRAKIRERYSKFRLFSPAKKQALLEGWRRYQLLSEPQKAELRRPIWTASVAKSTAAPVSSGIMSAPTATAPISPETSTSAAGEPKADVQPPKDPAMNSPSAP